MKQMKTGFSLAELLIGLVIAAIIATMGMSIAKRGIKNSYDAYIYTGYKGISDAISEANADGYTLNYSNVGNCDFTNDILKMFNVKEEQITSRTTSNIQFTAPNNITYKIITSGTTGSEETGDLKHYYTIKIWFPTPNLQAGQERRNVELVYAPDDNYGVLLPIPKDEPAPDSEEYKNSLWNLAKRKDLLMFYIDDGKTGRIDASGTYNKREYYSLNDTLCMTGKIITVIDGIEKHPGVDNPNLVESVHTLSERPANKNNQNSNEPQLIYHKDINHCNGNSELENGIGVIRPMNPRRG